jgi:hypothetical protein
VVITTSTLNKREKTIMTIHGNNSSDSIAGDLPTENDHPDITEILLKIMVDIYNTTFQGTMLVITLEWIFFLFQQRISKLLRSQKTKDVQQE